MNRRSFLQSIGAAMSAVALGARFTPDSPSIDYRLFTGGDGRYDLSSPFSVGGTVYATDGKVLVAHSGNVVSDAADRRVPDVSKLWWDEFDSGGFSHLRPIREKYPAQAECEACFGVGRTGNFVECQCFHADPETGVCLDCKDSGFRGGIECPVCDGTSCVQEDYCYEIDGEPFAPHMLARIKTLGDLEVKVLHEYPEYSTGHRQRHGIALFRGDHGIRGMLMGMYKMKYLGTHRP